MGYIKGIILAGWIALGLYFGIGGYLSIIFLDQREQSNNSPEDKITIKEIEYRNPEQYAYVRNIEMTKKIFPWLSDVPQDLATIITALCFGILGGTTRLVKQLSFEDGIIFKNIKVISIPLLGMLSGIIMLGLTFIIPTLLTSGDQELRPTTLVFLTLFAGLFAQRFYEWLSSSFHIIFPTPQ